MAPEKIDSERRRSRPVEKPKKVAVIKRNKARVGIILVIIAMIIIAALAVIYIHPAKNRVAVIDTTMGTIRVELYEDKAPITTANFIKLANDKFYDGLVFHRIIDNFMIQSGGFSPDGTQKTSPYGPINLETTDLLHDDGAISMARLGNDINSATSQFFICDGAQPDLDGKYAVFGKVIEGMDVVREIASVETTTKYDMEDWPLTDVIINNITIQNQ
jgi:peptidyl-prolyl cis-trans isomerase A (cyclophilin A)